MVANLITYMSPTYDPASPWQGVRRIGVLGIAELPRVRQASYLVLRNWRTGAAVGSMCWVGARVVVLLYAGSPLNGVTTAGDRVALIVRDVLVTTFAAGEFM